MTHRRLRSHLPRLPRTRGIAVALVLASSGALAGEPPLSTDARAQRLFTSGEKKFDSGDYDGACTDFAESLKLGPKLGTLLNLALCHETVGKVVTAWNEFAHGAAWAAQNNQKDRLEFATAHIRSLEPRLPRIALQLPADRAIDSLELDGEPVPEHRWYLPLYLDPGEHHVAVTAPGRKRTTVSFRVINTPTDQLVLVPPLPADIKVVQEEKDRRERDPLRRTLGFAGLGLGAAGIVAGGIFGVLAATRDSAEGAKTDAAVATACFVGGVAFAVTGGWLVWMSGPRAFRAAALPGRVALAGTF